MTSTPPPELLLFMTTVGDREQGETLVQTLLEEREIACGTLLPGATSLYRWEGAVQREEECLLLLKTTRAQGDLLQKRIHELHPYEVPEIIALDPERVSSAYEAWVRHQVKRTLPA
ncbi:divalent-cation tolerance protein CutA [bacterium]|nr:divalent-cation tolerance protein CutA [bacterium]